LVRRFWWRAAQVGLSAVLIVWVLSGLDAGSVAEARKLSSDRLLLALVLLALSQVWGGIRLWLLLRRQGSALGYGTVLRLTWFGFFTSNFLPGPVGGDVAKGALLIRSGLGAKIVVAALVADRLVNMATMIGVTAGCIVAGRLGMLLTAGHSSLPALWAVVGFAVLIPWSPAWLRRGNPIGMTRLAALVRAYLDIARLWLTWPVGLALALLLSGASILSVVLGQFVLLRDLGVGLGLLDFIAVIGLVYIVTLVPISLNGLGVREAGLVFLLGVVGTDRHAATVFAVVVRVLMVVISIPGAFSMISLKAADRKS